MRDWTNDHFRRGEQFAGQVTVSDYDSRNLPRLVTGRACLLSVHHGISQTSDKLRSVGLLAIAVLSNVSMHGMRIKPALAQATRQGVSHHHRAMTPAGATYAHRHIRLSLAFVKGQKVIKQVAKAFHRLTNLRLRS
jgi:hypothetical protein